MMGRLIDAEVCVGPNMATPARTAEQLLLGVGIVLLLATSFALIDGRLPPADCPDDPTLIEDPCTSSSEIGWLIPAGAILTLAIGLMMRFSRTSGTGPLFGNLFSDENDATTIARLTEEHSDAHDTDRLSGAWANLETKMLESTHEEE